MIGPQLLGLLDTQSPAILEALSTMARLAQVSQTLRVDTKSSSIGSSLLDDGPRPDTEDRQLRLAETRYRVLIEQIPVVTFLASLQEGRNEIYVSPQIETLLGFTQEEWVRDPVLWYRQVHPDDRFSLSREFAEMCINGTAYRGVIRVYTRDGSLRRVHMEARFVCDEHGAPLFLQGVGFDVSDQFAAQEAREQLLREQAAHEEAERERQRLLQVLSSLPAATAVLRGVDHIVEYVNPIGRQLAVGEGEVVGNPWRVAFPSFGGTVIEVLDRVRATRKPAGLTEYLSPDTSGTPRYFNFVCQPLPDFTSGDWLLLTHSVEVTNEVLARQQLEEAVQLRDETLEQMTAVARAREQFLSAAAHDLKTPIASTRAWAQVLRKRGAIELPEVDWLAGGVTAIEASAGRMAAQVEELLDLARLQSGASISLDRQPVDLVKLVQELVHDQQQHASRHTFRLEIIGGELVSSCDSLRMKRVIGNLLDNAIKYSPRGGEIVVGISRDDSQGAPWAVVTVEDHGIGIAHADLASIFEQFTRGSNVGTISGTGIGLNGARHIVTLHGGEIYVSSQEGSGSKFTIRLPL